MDDYSLKREPKGTVYHALLEHALGPCSAFLVVVRASSALSDSGRSVMRDLEPFLLTGEESSTWPGTELIGHTAHVFTYRLTAESVDVLKRASSRLFAWEQPQLPADLCLLRSPTDAWLTTIAREQDAWFHISWDEREALVKAVRGLGDLL
jgi:hypothetical protein